jgi:hypothetical protein
MAGLVSPSTACRSKNTDARHIGVRKRAVLRTAMAGHDSAKAPRLTVMAGLVPAIHVLLVAAL